MSAETQIATFEQDAPAEHSTLPAVEGTKSDALMQIINRAATDPSFDVAKLDQLLAVKERWEAEEARKAFVAALAAFKADPPSIVKDKHVKYGQTQYDHATLAQVASKCAEGLARHGLSHSWSIDQRNGVTVTCTLTHALGHRESVTMTAPPDNSGQKNAIQQTASTVTYLERYTLLAITGLAAGDQDDDGAAAGIQNQIDTRQKKGGVTVMDNAGQQKKPAPEPEEWSYPFVDLEGEIDTDEAGEERMYGPADFSTRFQDEVKRVTSLEQIRTLSDNNYDAMASLKRSVHSEGCFQPAYQALAARRDELKAKQEQAASSSPADAAGAEPEGEAKDSSGSADPDWQLERDMILARLKSGAFNTVGDLMDWYESQKATIDGMAAAGHTEWASQIQSAYVERSNQIAGPLTAGSTP